MGRHQAVMSVETAGGGSPDGGGRGMQRRAGRGRGRRPLLPRRRALAVLPARRASPPVRRAPPTRVLFEASSAERQRLRRAQRSMLRHMFSPKNAQHREVAKLLRRLQSEGGAPPAEPQSQLPECKTTRNYSCARCTFTTRSARDFLEHVRDTHFVKLKIHECPQCDYASKAHQKLQRHMKVHSTKVVDTMESMEDYLEEVEEGDEDQMEVEESFEPSDVEADKPAEVEPAPSEPAKGKKGFFFCDKCNYVTHIRGRYTKHVKYHSMPMIKCAICEFRTPYKWNLDRHNKNHGGTGGFHCSMCNFTADIKQSLTVHEMNHHTPPVGQSGASRRRNRVGGSDAALAASLAAKEDDGSADSGSDMCLQYVDREMLNCNSDSNDTSASDVAAKKDDLAQDTSSRQSPTAALDDGKSQKQARKIPRPPPPLIPLCASTPTQTKQSGEPPHKKFKETPSESTPDTNSTKKFENLPDISLIPVPNVPSKEPVVRKKNESFFDKLKERILTETGAAGSLKCKICGFESKCLSEHSVHEKNCSPLTSRLPSNTSLPSLGSTRCQNCRHRCKSSADLYVHMKTCKKKETVPDPPADVKVDNQNVASSSHEKEAEPHPMENVVFVWNNINPEMNNFDMPLDISINDDSTLPDYQRSYDSEIIDDNDGMNLSPSQAAGKKVFKCPHCPFWASTASRFHVHIVGHLNKKPFECSLCKYKSNWRWDITKHIKLKSARDPEHNEAKVLMTDETGRRNYSKYNKFLAMPIMNENGENEFHYIDPNTAVDAAMEIDESINEGSDNANSVYEIQPLDLQTYDDIKFDDLENRNEDSKKPKKTLWKCKKCNYKDPSKEALLEHVREHSKTDGNHDDAKKKQESAPDPADLAYRCGHCNQLSNWKHVIQRHCRLKHDGIIKVITTVKTKETMPSPSAVILAVNDMTDSCSKCPFKANDKKLMFAHMQQHQPSPQSIFKCYFCPYFVKDEHELLQHLKLHGINDPEDYLAKVAGKSPQHDPQAAVASTSSSVPTKRHKCTECPYETNSKSQYMYHEQFHRLPADTPYKCPECNYSVSKRHLLHQHLRVHGIFTNKVDKETEDASTSHAAKVEPKEEYPALLDEVPFVWVSAKNEFHKMYKCRYCSYVNSQKCKIPNHEKIHCFVFEKSELAVYKCLECKFTCDNAGRLAEHSKTHGEIYGRIYCPVEEDVPDEEQIAKLRKVIESEKANAVEELPKEGGAKETKEIRILYFCQKCPATFFSDNELRHHDKFHDLLFDCKCKSCEYSVPDYNELKAHLYYHSDEYHTKTKMLKFMHSSHPAHKESRLELIHCTTTSEITWVVSSPGKNFDDVYKRPTDSKHTPKQYCCKECPAKFFKSSALTTHMVLHGGEGEHKCKKCSYAVKNVGNLAKHEMLHEIENKSCDYESGDDMDFKNIPLSGTDLFQRKTEAQKRVLTDKDKLVKPNDHFPPVLQADPQFGYLMHGNPEFIYPTYLKNGRQKEKRYKCHKCPSAFEKREQYKIHLSLHGSKQRYKCELCDYSVKYYANYVQHMRKHQMNDDALAERQKGSPDFPGTETLEEKHEESSDHIKLAIKTMPKGTAKSDFQQFSISDQQTLRLLQRRRSLTSGKETNASEQTVGKDRKMHMCLLCPYTNQRLDALSNHYRRHEEADSLTNMNNKCSFCDLIVVQSHFLREHLKTHFSYQKSLTPECYVANEEVTFTITDVDEDTGCTDLKLDTVDDYTCNENKIYVKIRTGELVVE